MNGKKDDYDQPSRHVCVFGWRENYLQVNQSTCVFIFASLVGEKIDEKCFSFPLVEKIWSLVLHVLYIYLN